MFSRTERLLDAEQWLVDIIDLLKVAQIPDDNQVEVAKIQLRDVAEPGGWQKKRYWRSTSLGTSS